MPIHESDQPFFTIEKSVKPTDDFTLLIEQMVAEAKERIEKETKEVWYPEITVNEEEQKLCLTVYQYRSK